MSPFPSSTELLARLAELRSTIETAGATGEHDRKLPEAFMQSLRREGFYRSSLPKALNGGEHKPLELFQLVEQMAYYDSALAWVSMVYLTTATQSAFLDDYWRAQLFAADGPVALSAGAVAPMGRGRKTKDGITVSGRWAWGSGSHHAEWIVGGTLVEEGDGFVSNEKGEPLVHLLFLHRDQVELQDNWDPSGLRGTGSVDIVVREQSVPTGRWTILGNTESLIDGALYRFPYFGLFASLVTAVTVGITRRALDDFSDVAQNKVPAFQTRTINTSSVVQLQYGQAESLYLAAQQSMYRLLENTFDTIQAGNTPSIDDRRRLRMSATQSAQLCSMAVDGLYNAGGGTSVRGDCSLQRHFRDIHTATQHKLIAEDNLRLAGAIELAGKTPDSQL